MRNDSNPRHPYRSVCVIVKLLYHVILTQNFQGKYVEGSGYHFYNPSNIPMTIIGIKTSQLKTNTYRYMHFYLFT